MEQSSPDAMVPMREVSFPIHESRGWLRLLGVLAIVYGAGMALTIVGILIAWLPIWMGVLLLQSASAIERAHIAGDRQSLQQSLAKLRTFFTIQGVLAVLGLLAAVLALALGFLGALLALIGLS